jgi:hypothetical protein
MAARTKVVANRPLRGKEPLGMARCIESSHRSFPLARRLMAVFGPIVETFVLTMLDTGQQLLFRCALAPQLIGDQHTRDILTALEQRTEELLGGLLIPPTLHQDIQHVPVLINGAPHIVLLPSDGEEDLIEMPLVTSLCPLSVQQLGVVLAKCARPLPDRLIREDDPRAASSSSTSR